MGCGPATAPLRLPDPPATPAAAVQMHIADYIGLTDTLFVRENAGRLEGVWRGRVFDAAARAGGYALSAGGDTLAVRLAGDVAVIEGHVLPKHAVAAGTFRITPLRPVEELRAEALAALPPRQPDSLETPDLVELKSLDPAIRYDIRYATANNFMGAVFYSSAHAFLQRPAAEAVVRVSRKLQPYGYGLLIHDAYRPWYVTRMFWDATPDSLRDFVADPANGSRHNRGAAVDLTLYDLRTGAAVDMPSGYDEFSARAFPAYPGGTQRQRYHRDLLRTLMEQEGFTVYDFEWWHFDYNGWRRYPIGTATFEEIQARSMRRESR